MRLIANIAGKSMLFSLLLGAFVSLVHCQCDLNNPNFAADNGIFLVRNNNQYDLLFTNFLQPGQTVYRMCNHIGDIIPITCGANSVLQPGNLQRPCTNPLTAVVQLLPPQNGCAPDEMYAVGFMVNRRFLEMYRSCLDVTTRSTIYTVHRLVHHGINRNNAPLFFTTEIVGNGILNEYRPQSVSQYFRTNLPNLQIGNQRILSRGHLTAAGDYFFLSQKIATYKLLNVVPQFVDINNGNWRKLEIYQHGVARNYGDLQIITGTSNVLRLQNHQMYLHNNNQLRVPKWTFKVVISATRTTVFLTSNNIYANEPLPNFCRQVNCPAGLHFVQTIQEGLTYCCNPRHFLNSHQYLQTYWHP